LNMQLHVQAKPEVKGNGTKVVRVLLGRTIKEHAAMSPFKNLVRRALPVILLLAVAIPTQAASFTFTANLSGPGEAPPNASPGTGFATIVFDNVAHTLSVNVAFSGLLANTTASHIHCCAIPPAAAGVATQLPTFAGFPLGVTSGTFSNVLDLTSASSYNPAFVTLNGGSISASEAALLAGALAGTAYLNIHTTQFGGGEIRGFLAQVPELSTMSLLFIGVIGIVGLGWSRRRSER